MNQGKYKTLGECCPIFNVEKWDEKTFHWENKHFIKESVPAFFHFPFFPMIGKKVTKLMKLAEKTNKLEANKEDILLLFFDPTPFKSEMYLAVTDNVAGASNSTLTGTFKSKVFDGENKEIRKFFKEMDAYLSKKGEKAKNYYIHYAYCPKCSKEAGHNYMVMFAEM